MIQSNGSSTSPYQQGENQPAIAAHNPDWIKSVIGFVLIAIIGFGLLSANAKPASSPATVARQVMTRAAAAAITFPINRAAALYVRASEMGWGEPITAEVHFTFGGKPYVAQGYKPGIIFTEVGHWARHEVQVLKW